MTRRFVKGAALAAVSALAIQIATPRPAEARDGAAIAAGIGGLMLGMIAAGAMAQQQPQRGYRQVRAPKPKPRAPVVSSATVAVQNALVAFGFYAGPVNGRSDSPTRNAIKAFQLKLGEAATGTLTEAQRRSLLTAYAQRGQGQLATAPSPDSIFAVIAGGAAAGAVVASVVSSPALADAPAGSASPLTADTARAPDSWRQQCQSANPAFEPAPFGQRQGSVAGSLVPGQFCVARVSALLTAKDAVAKLVGVEPAQIRQECGRIAESLAPLRAAVLAEPPATIVKKAGKDFAAVGPEQREAAAGNFQICLGSGFADNAPEIVISAALSLVGIGEGGYGEIIGGAFALGSGVDANRAKAMAWIDQAADAIDKGAGPVLKDRGVERAAILRLVSAELKGGVGPRPQNVVAAAAPREAERPPVPSFGAAVQTPPAAPALVASTAPVIGTVASPSSVQPLKAVDPEPALPPPVQLASTGPELPTPATARRAAAESFFASEQAEHAGRLPGLAAALGLDPGGLLPLCVMQENALAEPKPEAALPIRLCRSWAYSRSDRLSMYRFDRALSDLGDTDAESRLARHLLLGNDRVAGPIPR